MSSFEKMATYAPSEYTEDGYVKYDEDNPIIKEAEQKQAEKDKTEEQTKQAEKDKNKDGNG